MSFIIYKIRCKKCGHRFNTACKAVIYEELKTSEA